jgi:hypothetical protein
MVPGLRTGPDEPAATQRNRDGQAMWGSESTPGKRRDFHADAPPVGLEDVNTFDCPNRSEAVMAQNDRDAHETPSTL